MGFSFKNILSIFLVSYSDYISGTNGGYISFYSTFSQSIPLKKGWFFISVAPYSDAPNL